MISSAQVSELTGNQSVVSFLTAGDKSERTIRSLLESPSWNQNLLKEQQGERK